MRSMFFRASLALLFLSFTYSQQASQGAVKGYISKNKANLMIQSYLNTLPDSTALKSWIVDAELLRHYLSNKEIKGLKVMLAQKTAPDAQGSSATVPGSLGKDLTLVFGGYDASGNFIFASSGDLMVPNHASPCPNNCPKNGTASADIFP